MLLRIPSLIQNYCEKALKLTVFLYIELTTMFYWGEHNNTNVDKTQTNYFLIQISEPPLSRTIGTSYLSTISTYKRSYHWRM